MSDHLPECMYQRGRKASWLYPSKRAFPCICPNIQDAYERGHAAGIQAARDAVAALPIITIGLCDKGRALAAIDNLEKP